MADDYGMELFDTALGIVGTHVLGVVARLGVADALGDDGTTVADAAARTGVPEDRLVRLLRVATVQGLVEQPEPGVFAPTSVGRALRRDHPSGTNALADLFSRPEFVASFPGLEDQMRTGAVAFDAAHGKPFFDWNAERPEAAASFNRAMRSWTRWTSGPLAAQGEFERFGTLVDVGGGNGTLLCDVLAAHPSLRGIVFDSPEGAAQAPATLEAAGFADRCTVETGDFFRSVPRGGDAYLMKNIIHDWDDEKSVAILGTCRDALPEHGRVLLVEMVLDERPEHGAGTLPYLMDMAMLVLGGGKERTRGEFDALFQGAGLKTDRLVEVTGTGFHVVEAVRA